MEDVNNLQQELARFTAALPDWMKLNDQNIATHMATQHNKTGFIMVHTWISQLHIDLYRFSLPGIREQANPNLLRKLPKEFIAKSQKQVVAHALNLARFWDSIRAEIIRQTGISHPLISGDYMMSSIVAQVAKVLIKAQQYQLYHDLNVHTTAPLWRNEEANDATVRALIDSSVLMIEPWLHILPSVRPTVCRTNQSRES